MGAVRTSRTDRITSRTKQIHVKFHRGRFFAADNEVDVKYNKTGFQKADILTKILGALKYIPIRLMLLGK